MVAPPSGTVTFLFTDVEGSTRRWESDAGRMSAELAAHDRLVRATVAAHDGSVFATGGDGFAVAFSDALSAVQAAREIQQLVVLPVRMGLNSGTAEERDGNYFGPVLNRGSRIMSAGHGGQILLSDATASLVRDHVVLVDLGVHQLVGVDATTRVWQVGTSPFPTLRTATTSVGNIPATVDTFVGRDVEMNRVSELVSVSRLVSIVGVGGIGKTRLALELCHRMERDVHDGVWFVDLGRTSSGDPVATEVARSLSVQSGQGQSILDRVVQHLAEKRALLVFDNCEHVLEAAAVVIERLLREAPEVKILTTSREALMLNIEKVVPIGPLVAESHDGGRDVDDAVALFADRIGAAGSAFDPNGPDGVAAAEICSQLDCMPLAIELAAARARTIGVSGVLKHLGERLRLLSGGSRTGVGRQRTLVATLDWSYVLLSDFEQRVFDRLGVLMTWFVLEDAIALCSGDDADDVQVMDAVSALVDKSMCVFDPLHHPPRYRYLETVKTYALDHLASTGAIVECRDRHARHFATTARQFSAELIGPREREAGLSVQRVMSDLRSALMWALDREMDDIVAGLATLAELLLTRGDNEMSGWFFDQRHELPSSRPVQQAALAHALHSRGDATESRRLADLLMKLDGAPIPVALSALAYAAYFVGEFDAAIEFGQKAYDLTEQRGSNFQRVIAPTSWAIVLAVSGRDGRAAAHEGLARTRQFGWPTGIALAYYAKGLANSAVDPNESLAAYERSIEAAVVAGNPKVEGMGGRDRMELLMNSWTIQEVAGEMSEVLRGVEHRNGDNFNLELSQSAVVLQRAGRPEDASVIYGWLDGRTNRMATNIDVHNNAMAAAEKATGDKWHELLEQGRDMPLKTLLERVQSALEITAASGSPG